MITVAVSGINAIDNPGPGTGIAQSLKLWAEQENIEVRVIGLAYDAMEPGIYMDWVIDKAYVMPYPSGHVQNYLERMQYIIHKENVDVWIPALDVELPLFIQIQKEVEAMGVKLRLPDRKTFQSIQKSNLDPIAEKIGISMPKGKSISSDSELHQVGEDYGYPFMVKGPFYEAHKVYNLDQAVKAFHELAYKWGHPILVQKFISGEEYNVIGLSDGSGTDMGHLSVKKLMVTKQGKVWTNVSIKNPELEVYVKNFLSATKWSGGFELEVLLEEDSQKFHLIEINPRFPAWVYMASHCGVNLPSRLVKSLLGLELDTSSDYDVGKMLIRYTGEMVRSISDFEQLSTYAESL